jgi:hypothetical protein
MLPWASGSEQTQSVTFQSPGDSETLYSGNLGYGEYGSVEESAYLGHYDERVPYHPDCSPGAFGFDSAHSTFSTRLDPNLISGINSGLGSPAIPLTTYPLHLDH